MENAHELWNKTWSSDIHISDHAKKRIMSAKSAKLTPIKIDTIDLYGYFQGSSGRYETFLDKCSCIDFVRNKKPCKHIYRLAMELCVIDNSGMSANENMIPIPQKEKKETLAALISILENGGYEVMNAYYSNYKDAPFFADPEDHATSYLLSNMFWDEVRNPIIFDKLKKDMLIGFIQKINPDYPKEMKLNELKLYILENFYSEFRNEFPNRIACVISESYSAFHNKFRSYCKKVVDQYSYLANCELITAGNGVNYVIPNSELNILFYEHGHMFDLEVKNNPYIIN